MKWWALAAVVLGLLLGVSAKADGAEPATAGQIQVLAGGHDHDYKRSAWNQWDDTMNCECGAQWYDPNVRGTNPNVADPLNSRQENLAKRMKRLGY